MKKTDIVTMLAMIKTIYPYYAKDTDMQLAVETWHSLLKDYDETLIKEAFNGCLKTCRMPPTPADVISRVQEILQAQEPPDLFGQYRKTLDNVYECVCCFRYTYVDETGLSQGEQARRKVSRIWQELNPILKEYIGSEGELISRARSATEDDLKFERVRFEKLLPELRQKIATRAIAQKLSGGKESILPNTFGKEAAGNE